MSAYVDDLKMVGRAESIAPMWKEIRGKIDLAPETDLVAHVYLGCTQRDSKPSKSVVRDRQEFFAKRMPNQTKGSDPEAGVRQHSFQSCVALYSPKGIARTTMTIPRESPNMNSVMFSLGLPTLL